MTESVLQAKKDYSRLGLSLFTIAGITTVLQLVLGIIMGSFMTDSALANSELLIWILTMAPMYLVAVPIGFVMMKKIPADAPQKQKLKLQ